MATGWVRSLHCKSNALEDVQPPTPSLSRKPLLTPLSCGNSSHALRDVVVLFPKHPPLPPKRPTSNTSNPIPKPPPPPQPKPKSRHRTRPKSRAAKPIAPSSPAAPLSAPAGPLPTLTELPAGHSSRRVVEIIFISSWSPSGRGSPPAAAFPGEIEMLFRVHNPVRTVARFEEYRAAVRARASRSDDARCAADGNEMMRFAAAGGIAGGEGVYDAVVAWSAVRSPATGGEAAEGIRTFSGSGIAHAGGGGGEGRRAMLVCRVIAGQVRYESDRPASDFDSVRLRKGELLVFDPRAVLPCFLIIYRV